MVSFPSFIPLLPSPLIPSPPPSPSLLSPPLLPLLPPVPSRPLLLTENWLSTVCCSRAASPIQWRGTWCPSKRRGRGQWLPCGSAWHTMQRGPRRKWPLTRKPSQPSRLVFMQDCCVWPECGWGEWDLGWLTGSVRILLQLYIRIYSPPFSSLLNPLSSPPLPSSSSHLHHIAECLQWLAEGPVPAGVWRVALELTAPQGHRPGSGGLLLLM